MIDCGKKLTVVQNRHSKLSKEYSGDETILLDCQNAHNSHKNCAGVLVYWQQYCTMFAEYYGNFVTIVVNVGWSEIVQRALPLL